MMMLVPRRRKVVSELDQMGHREGEALTKIDSLGYHLASLLDNHDHIIGLDVSHTIDLFIYLVPGTRYVSYIPTADVQLTSRILR